MEYAGWIVLGLLGLLVLWLIGTYNGLVSLRQRCAGGKFGLKIEGAVVHPRDERHRHLRHGDNGGDKGEDAGGNRNDGMAERKLQRLIVPLLYD